MMAEYLPLDRFKAIYVVDLCRSLCEVAKKKAEAKGWANVHVMEADACGFRPPEGEATLITFSYSLSSEEAGPGPGAVLGAHATRVALGAPAPGSRVPASRVHTMRRPRATGPTPSCPSPPIPRSDPPVHRRRGQRHQLARARRPPGGVRLFRERALRCAHAPDGLGAALLLAQRV